mgnify:CR=1 FL=1
MERETLFIAAKIIRQNSLQYLKIVLRKTLFVIREKYFRISHFVRHIQEMLLFDFHNRGREDIENC